MTSDTHTPWHFWLIAILGVVWFSGGAFDYVMTATDNQDYLSALTPDQRAWLDVRPTWFTACWATSVWFSLLGSVIMLLRKRVAGMIFLVSVVAYIPCAIYSYLLSDPSAFAITGMFGVVFSIVIFLSLVFFFTYCGAMARRGVLR